MPKALALIVTIIVVIVILLATSHLRKMTTWVDTDEFGAEPVPRLPDENRSLYLGSAATIIGVVSLVALVLLS